MMIITITTTTTVSILIMSVETVVIPGAPVVVSIVLRIDMRLSNANDVMIMAITTMVMIRGVYMRVRSRIRNRVGGGGRRILLMLLMMYIVKSTALGTAATTTATNKVVRIIIIASVGVVGYKATTTRCYRFSTLLWMCLLCL